MPHCHRGGSKPDGRFIVEDLEKLAAFLRELGELSRKYGMAIGDPTTVFIMEPEDYQTEYKCDAESVLSFG
jgi:hypothetical protein